NRAGTPDVDVSGLPKAKFTFVEPMLAKLVQDLAAGSQWQYEVKLDGYRAIAARTKTDVTLFSRRGNKLNDRFPSLPEALSELPDDTIVDGEIVALDDAGKPSFSTLQNVRNIPPASLRLYLFDVLAWLGKDVRSLPLAERRKLLKAVSSNLKMPILISEV